MLCSSRAGRRYGRILAVLADPAGAQARPFRHQPNVRRWWRRRPPANHQGADFQGWRVMACWKMPHQNALTSRPTKNAVSVRFGARNRARPSTCSTCHGSGYGAYPPSHFPNAADLSDLPRHRQRNQRPVSNVVAKVALKTSKTVEVNILLASTTVNDPLERRRRTGYASARPQAICTSTSASKNTKSSSATLDLL